MSTMEQVTLEVFNPAGTVETTHLHAPRIDTLADKTICEFSNGAWEARRTFPLIRSLLQKQFPTVKIIPYTEFPVGVAAIDVKKIAEIAKENGCQAAILGNSG